MITRGVMIPSLDTDSKLDLQFFGDSGVRFNRIKIDGGAFLGAFPV